jgi:hypothetical protein
VEHDKDVKDLTERSRAPFCHPVVPSPELEAQLLAARIHPEQNGRHERLHRTLKADHRRTAQAHPDRSTARL